MNDLLNVDIQLRKVLLKERENKLRNKLLNDISELESKIGIYDSSFRDFTSIADLLEYETDLLDIYTVQVTGMAKYR